MHPRADLRAARQARGLTQQAVADAIGKTQDYVSRIESGSVLVSAKFAPMLADVLELPIVVVLYGPDSEHARAA